MRWSWRIAKVSGIGIYLHFTFPLLLLWGGTIQYSERHNWADAWSGIAFILVLFAIVVLHELGHSLMARRFGIRTRDITLLPIGGVARLERIPEDPKAELLIALAGPAVNICLAAVFFLMLAAGALLTGGGPMELFGGGFLATLMVVNVMLAAFNMVPAFPMDGGRVLRALLAGRIGHARATAIAAKVGQVLAVAFGVSALFLNQPFWVVLAVFVYLGAAQEAVIVRTKCALSGLSVGQLMLTEFRVLGPEDALSRAADYLLTGWQHDFPVVEEGQAVGLLTRRVLLKGLSEGGEATKISEVMYRDFATAQPEDPAESGFGRMKAEGWRTLVVMRNGELVGILTGEQLEEYMLVQAALARAGQAKVWRGGLSEKPAG